MFLNQLHPDRHLWCENNIPLTYRDQLLGNRYFVPWFRFYIESVMLTLPFIPESVFYTQSVMLSPRFIPESVFYCRFSHDVTKIQTSKLLILLIFYFNKI